MTTIETVLQTLAQALDECGTTKIVDSERVLFEPMSMEVMPEVVHEDRTAEGVVLGIAVAAHVPQIPDKHIAVTVFGTGDNIEEAVSFAIFQWFNGVFHVLQSAFDDSHPVVEEVGVREMISRDDGRQREFAWKVHLGNMQTLYYGDSSESDNSYPAGPGETDLLAAMLDEVSGVSVHADPFWLEIFAAKNNDGTATADCRLYNSLWEDGTEALHAYASSWDLPKGIGLMSCRQFILFMPAAREEMVHLDDMHGKLAEYARPVKESWWRRFFRR